MEGTVIMPYSTSRAQRSGDTGPWILVALPAALLALMLLSVTLGWWSA